jgi:predicted kinase
MNTSAAMAPDARHDLRGQAVTGLRYPNNAVVVVAGLPGAGKTTLLRRVFATARDQSLPVRTRGGVRLLDSEQSRDMWRRYLGWLPYRLWRPIVHVTHYGRVLRVLSAGSGPVILHDCATRSWTRWLIVRSARRSNRRVHLLLLDVSPRVAGAAQVARGRQIRSASFVVHCRRWASLIEAVDDESHGINRDTASVVLIDRSAATRLSEIQFTT